MPRLDARGKEIAIDLEGETISAIEGEPLACALLAAGERVFARSIKYHRPRGPFCFAAACSHCLMRVDGVPNAYTCRVPARAGMRLERQNAYPSVRFDLFAATDWMFPRGMDHHEMFAGVPIAEKIMAKVARQLAGLGLLPDAPAPVRERCEIVETPLAIVGAGAAGLAAARVLAARKAPFLLLERDGALGGRLANAPVAEDDPAIPLATALPGGSVRTHATAVGLFEDARGPFLCVAQPAVERLLLVYAEKFLLCMGGHPQLVAFENNDMPGVFAGRAVSQLIRRHRYLPGEKIAIVGSGAEAKLLQLLIERSGGAVAATVAEPLRAHGRTHVTALTFRDGAGKKRKVSCDAIAICAPPSPSFELARQGGAVIRFDDAAGLFVVDADADGRTRSPRIFAAGEITGPMDAKQADAMGTRAAALLHPERRAAGEESKGAPR